MYRPFGSTRRPESGVGFAPSADGRQLCGSVLLADVTAVIDS
jgi:hypothetical protein